MDEQEKKALEELAAAIPKFYASNVRVRTNVHDVSFFFSRAVPVGAQAGEVECPVCVVSVSPALMMSMFRIMERHIKIYEEKHEAKLPDKVEFGEVPKPGEEPTDG